MVWEGRGDKDGIAGWECGGMSRVGVGTVRAERPGIVEDDEG